jgi:hypothetical protein
MNLIASTTNISYFRDTKEASVQTEPDEGEVLLQELMGLE